jgi:glycosyltransferase involved in cell wall biosynthesis
MEPIIDILLPTYKPHADHLRAAVESVLAQTEQRWRLTICDEPTDVQTESMLTEYLPDPRIRFSQNEKRLGIGGNWNRCLEKATAPYVQYMFQDDVWEPGYLTAALEVFEKNEHIGMVSMGHRYRFEGHVSGENAYAEVERARAETPEGAQDGREFLLSWMERGLHPNIIGEPSFVCLRRSVMENAGPFREDLPQNLDSEYWCRMLIAGDWYNLRGHFGDFRVHGDAASAQNQQSGTGIFDRMKTLRSVSSMLPVEHREHAKRIIQGQTKRMVEKFFLRYGGKTVQIADGTSLWIFLLIHPILLMRSMWKYVQNRRGVNG